MNQTTCLFFLFCLAFGSCKNDDTDIIDINSFPLALDLEGYQNTQIRTFTVNGELENTAITFNDDAYFNERTYQFDRFIFLSADTISFVKTNGTAAAQNFNETFEKGAVTYGVDSVFIQFLPSETLPEGYFQAIQGDRSQLRTGYHQTKLRRTITGATNVQTGAVPDNYDLQLLINALQNDDTLSIQSYDLIYQP